MKKLLAFLLALVMVLSLSACDLNEALSQAEKLVNDLESLSTGLGDLEDLGSLPLGGTDERTEEWYRQGFQLSFEYDECYGDMYCDGTSLWYIMHQIPREGSPSYTQRFSVEPESDTTFKRLWHMSDGRPAETKIYDGEALDYYFTRNLEYDNLGGLLNKVDNQFFNFQMYKKTDQTETVAGRSCTIYKMESEYERTISVDDEFGIVLKIQDTFLCGTSNNGVFFEVTSIQFGPTTPPDDVMIQE